MLLERNFAVLAAAPGAIRSLLGGLPDALTHADYGEGTFSPYNVVGHLIIGERTDWVPRTRLILERGVDHPFDPFDHTATMHPEGGPRLGELIDEFATLRAANLETIRRLGLEDAELALRGTHPGFGEVTLGQLLSAWVAHDLHHVAQICKGLARQWSDDVGPWREYIGILNR